MESYLKIVFIILLFLIPFPAVFIPAESEAPLEEEAGIETYGGTDYLETLIEQEKSLEEAKSELEMAEAECRAKETGSVKGCDTFETIVKVVAGFISGGVRGRQLLWANAS